MHFKPRFMVAKKSFNTSNFWGLSPFSWKIFRSIMIIVLFLVVLLLCNNKCPSETLLGNVIFSTSILNCFVRSSVVYNFSTYGSSCKSMFVHEALLNYNEMFELFLLLKSISNFEILKLELHATMIKKNLLVKQIRVLNLILFYSWIENRRLNDTFLCINKDDNIHKYRISNKSDLYLN